MEHKLLKGNVVADKITDNVYNVGDDSMNYSKESICQIIEEKTKALVHYEEVGQDADQRNYVVSYNKINDLGFNVTIGVEQGIDEIIEALKVIQTDNSYNNGRYF